MATEIYLGNPPTNIKDWIIFNSKTYWEKVVYNLENLPNVSFISDKTTFGFNELPSPGSALTIDYMTRDGYYSGSTFTQTLTTSSVLENLDKITPVSTDFVVLGYNGHVPKYIKYKNGNVYKYVSSTGTGTTRTEIIAGAKIYKKSWIDSALNNSWTETSETVTSVSSDKFTYGQTNSAWGTNADGATTYSVPMSITVGNTTYTFCGYTMTLNSRYILPTSINGSTKQDYLAFDSGNDNYWYESDIRTWLNTVQGASENNLTIWNSSTKANGLRLKFAKSQDMLKQMMPVVNRTWKYNGDTTEDIEDNFFLLSIPEINCNGSDGSATYFKDYTHRLVTFDVFAPLDDIWGNTHNSRIKQLMSLDGIASSADYWWLRSAYSDISDYVGYVYSDGIVYHDNACDSNLYGCSPAFVLG